MKMIKRTLQFSIALAGILLVTQSCSKVEGPGGSSSIVGKIHVEKYDVAGNLVNEYDGSNEDVYLIYGGDGGFYDDDVKTSYDGTFEFKYLQKGSYQLFVYQNCVTCPSGEEAVIVDIEITDNKSIKDIGVITIKD